MADGVDDETWLHHLRNGEYSEWFRQTIKDEDLAEETAQIERDQSLSPAESRMAIREAIEKRYTAPTSGPYSLTGSSDASTRA
jgi:hypothetical protein